MRLAAIDCGTHSIRLLISDVNQNGHATDVVRLMEIVGLGEGVDRTGHLSRAALDRTFAAVERYVNEIRSHEVKRVRMVATSASRDADNFFEFGTGIEARLGIAPELISGKEEASLGFAGTLSAHTGLEKPVLVVDIGGGSTEFAFGNTALEDGISRNMGSTRITERYLRPAEDDRGVPSEAAISEAARFIDSQIRQTAAVLPICSAREVIGVAGSVTTLTALELGLKVYDPQRINGAVIPSDRLRQRASALIRMPHEEKRALGPMHPQRVGQIAGGVLIWERILSYLEQRPAAGGDEPRGSFPVRTSENDILDGIILNLARAEA